MSPKLIVVLLVTATLVGSFGATDAATKKREKKLARPHAPVLVARPADPYAVYWAGTYVGSDPDPNIRFQMLREFQFLMNNQ